jgi:hypothetical protein
MIFGVIVVGGLAALAVAGAGLAKLLGVPEVRGSAQRFAIPFAAYRLIGALEILGAAGIIAGLWRIRNGECDLGVLAASCLFLMVVGAVATHVRASDPPARWAPRQIVAHGDTLTTTL